MYANYTNLALATSLPLKVVLQICMLRELEFLGMHTRQHCEMQQEWFKKNEPMLDDQKYVLKEARTEMESSDEWKEKL